MWRSVRVREANGYRRQIQTYPVLRVERSRARQPSADIMREELDRYRAGGLMFVYFGGEEGEGTALDLWRADGV